jgi:hypothetical protein
MQAKDNRLRVKETAMYVFNRTKRSVGMVLGDFVSLIGIIAFMTGTQTLGGILLVTGICIYGVAAAATWLFAKASEIAHRSPR